MDHICQLLLSWQPDREEYPTTDNKWCFSWLYVPLKRQLEKESHFLFKWSPKIDSILNRNSDSNWNWNFNFEPFNSYIESARDAMNRRQRQQLTFNLAAAARSCHPASQPFNLMLLFDWPLDWPFKQSDLLCVVSWWLLLLFADCCCCCCYSVVVVVDSI